MKAKVILVRQAVVVSVLLGVVCTSSSHAQNNRRAAATLPTITLAGETMPDPRGQDPDRMSEVLERLGWEASMNSCGGREQEECSYQFFKGNKRLELTLAVVASPPGRGAPASFGNVADVAIYTEDGKRTLRHHADGSVTAMKNQPPAWLAELEQKPAESAPVTTRPNPMPQERASRPAPPPSYRSKTGLGPKADVFQARADYRHAAELAARNARNPTYTVQQRGYCASTAESMRSQWFRLEDQLDKMLDYEEKLIQIGRNADSYYANRDRLYLMPLESYRASSPRCFNE